MNANAAISYMAVQAERDGLDRRAARAWLAVEAAGEERPHSLHRVPLAARRWLGSLVSHGTTRASRPSLVAPPVDHLSTGAS
ncbi:MAG TPA: hypothetical protein VH482_07730 [Thermomicrobiales bacterium]|jgi:hypothetical protein